MPTRLVSGGVDWKATDKLRLSLSVNGQYSYYLEPTNTTDRFGGFVQASAEASYHLNRTVELQVQVKNLTDERYEYVWWDGTQSLHSPGEARGVHAALLARF